MRMVLDIIGQMIICCLTVDLKVLKLFKTLKIMEQPLKLSDELVHNKIYIIRGQKVMMDADLAELYDVDTRRLNEQVRRNINRFPSDFMFELTDEEYANLKSQFATSSWGGRRKLPLVFTEHGVLMLSSVLSSERASEVNIQIVRVFTKMRAAIMDVSELRNSMLEIEAQMKTHAECIEAIFKWLDKLTPKNPIEGERVMIGYRQ